ncbi:hypothetical protein Q3G72_019830 [Acer saccharum]|nr:hypothetical protein Q3G72_019830 [Acer saccharum]
MMFEDDGFDLGLGDGVGGDGAGFDGCRGWFRTSIFSVAKDTSEFVEEILVCEVDSSEFVVWEANRSKLLVGTAAGNLVWEADKSDKSELVVGTVAGNLVWEADKSDKSDKSELVVCTAAGTALGTVAGDNQRLAAVSTHGDVPHRSKPH